MKALRMPRRPRNRNEWQAAVDAADACLHLDSARKCGLCTGGPDIDVERCESLLQEGKQRGYEPSPDNVERFIAELALTAQPSRPPRRTSERTRTGN